MLLLLLLTGCSSYQEEVSVDVVGVPELQDTAEGESCQEVLSAADTALLAGYWALEGERAVWTEEVQSLGLAQVYRKGGLELLVLDTQDPSVYQDWTDGSPPGACPMSAWEESCDIAECEDAVGEPCAWLLQLPCALDPLLVLAYVTNVAEALEEP